MSFTTIGIVTASLTLFGFFMLISLNINNFLLSLENQCEINVYLSADTKEATITQIERDLKNIDGVSEAKFFSKEERLQRAKETTYKDKEYMLEDLENDNPLRDSFILYIENIGISRQVAEKASDIDGVAEVKDLQELADKIKQVASAVRKIGGVLMLILALVSIFIIINTIRLCLTASSTEITIMRYVGASNSYISGPFLIEGILLGIVGALIAFGFVSWGYGAALQKIIEIFGSDSLDFVDYKDVWTNILYTFSIIGAVIGFVGSEISIRRYLKA